MKAVILAGGLGMRISEETSAKALAYKPHSPPLTRLAVLNHASDWEVLCGQRLLLIGGAGFIGKSWLGTFLHASRADSIFFDRLQST